VIFNNNNLDYAPRAAARLRAALGQLMSVPSQTPELFLDYASEVARIKASAGAGLRVAIA